MNLHEYQAKDLLLDYGVPVLPGYLAYTPREAQKAAVNLGSGVCVVKAQIHAGGRGKGGGVKVVKSPEEARDVAEKILGMNLISPQTGPEGKLVKKVWVEVGADIAREFYISLVVDRANAGIAFIVSAEGGMEIEEIADQFPEKILNVVVKPESDLQRFHIRRIANFLDLDKQQSRAIEPVLRNLYYAFAALDCDMLEINPLILTEDGEFICLDAKVSIDDNALFRQRTVFEFADYDEIDERELIADEVGLSYIPLDGNIGCMVNGAGLAMATMDLIKSSGGNPANFLDVGGGATEEMVAEAFKLILSDENVKGVFVNIFGGIMRCDVIANGILQATKKLNIDVPVVVRLQGTNVEIGRQILDESSLDLIPVDDLAEAARKIVSLINC